MNMLAPASDELLTFDGVRVTAGKVTILDDIHLTLTNGSPTVLIGPNGAGKTTLLRAAMGLVPSMRGSVTWGPDNKTPRRRAMLFQRSVMLRRSASGNLRHALAAAGVAYGQRKARAVELLSLVGLEALEKRPARRLSGGEQRRLALARALARDPALLFLDEPTASLDPAAAKAIEDIILGASSRGVKVVMSTHDIGQARRLAGEIIVLHRGRIIEHNEASAFFAAPRTEEAVKFLAGELLV
jgi:tungstate transport system ATP-binding protein